MCEETILLGILACYAPSAHSPQGMTLTRPFHLWSKQPSDTCSCSNAPLWEILISFATPVLQRPSMRRLTKSERPWRDSLQWVFVTWHLVLKLFSFFPLFLKVLKFTHLLEHLWWGICDIEWLVIISLWPKVEHESNFRYVTWTNFTVSPGHPPPPTQWYAPLNPLLKLGVPWG